MFVFLIWKLMNRINSQNYAIFEGILRKSNGGKYVKTIIKRITKTWMDYRGQMRSTKDEETRRSRFA